jgi:hypothetical protein
LLFAAPPVARIPTPEVSAAVTLESSKFGIPEPWLITSFPFVGFVVPIPTFPPATTFNPCVPPTLKSEEKRLVELAVVLKKLVVVAEVPVAFTKVKFWRVVEPVRRRLPKVPEPRVREPMLALVLKRLVELEVVEKKLVVVAFVVVELVAVRASVEMLFETREAMVPRVLVRMEEKKLVEVALVEVELTAVKFWRVVEPVSARLPTVAVPREPVPRLKLVEKRLVEDAVVEKKFVVVAEVPVAFRKVKFWRVVEPVTKRLPKVPEPRVREPKLALVLKRLVEEAVVLKKFVVVAEVPVAFTKVKFWRVEEAEAIKFGEVIEVPT